MFWKRSSSGDAPAASEMTTAQIEARELALQKAYRLADELDWPGMVEHLHATLVDFPDDPFVLCWLGVAERELGMDGIAYERFKECLAAQPEDAHVLAVAGNGLAGFDDPGAEPALRAATLIDPELALGRWLYGAYLLREGLPDQGLRELQAARDLEPDNAEITYELGVALARRGNHEGAVDEFYRATELGDDDGWTRVVLGLALLEEERFDEAVGELTHGARARRDDVQAQILASLAAAREGLLDLAWEMLERSRQVAAGGDLALAEEVAEVIDRGAEEASTFLTAEVASGVYRQRLGERP